MLHLSNLPLVSSERLSYLPIPEFSTAALPSVIGSIFERRKRHMPSYGAFVLRSGGGDAATLAWQLIRSQTDDYVSYKFVDLDVGAGVSAGGENSMQRTHSDPGIRNDITIHHTWQGIAEVIVLDVMDDELVAVHADYFGNTYTEQLFTLPTYPYKLDGTPLRTTLNEGDLLLLDHTLPHAVWSQTDNRVSTVEFYVNG